MARAGHVLLLGLILVGLGPSGVWPSNASAVAPRAASPTSDSTGAGLLRSSNLSTDVAGSAVDAAAESSLAR